jgi:hypothetical protein
MVGAATVALMILIVVYMSTNEARVARVAKLVISAQQDVLPRLATNEGDIQTLKQNTGDRWTRSSMAQWCIEFVKLNPTVRCPSPFVIAPKESDSGSITNELDRLQQKTDRLEKSIKGPQVPQPSPSS